jgi:hypothetical protein
MTRFGERLTVFVFATAAVGMIVGIAFAAGYLVGKWLL